MPREKTPLPSRDQLLAFVKDSDTPVGRREIARAFKIKGADRAWLRHELKDLKEQGLIGGDRRRATKPGFLPPVTVLDVSHIDADGDVICKPAKPEGDGAPPTIYLLPARGIKTAPGIGDRVLARLKRLNDGTYEARPIKLLEKAPAEMIGLFRASTAGGVLQSIDRRSRHDFTISKEHCGDAQDGDYVVAQTLAGMGQNAKIIERLGSRDDPKITSILVLKAKGVPMTFDAEAIELADAKKIPPLGSRTDLRNIPLITIDGADARDFDDAVWAEPDTSAQNKGGWHLLVAIADVSHYVRDGDALDRTARLRGNSVYCPDRVVPMLPEALSNGVCSLKPNEVRACLATEIWINSDGKLLRSEFKRALMRSTARLTYEQVQHAYDGHPDEATGALLDPVIKPLYGAFKALDQARRKRGTLELDLPERQILFDEAGNISAIKLRERLDSHRLIEEFMIAANVAAAKTLEAKKMPVMYRIHEPPALEKMEALGQALNNLGIKLTKSGALTPALFAGILNRVAGTDTAPLVSELILRCQSQAVYGPTKLGHFGLALKSYCHFTSPIRRYSDVLVHRALIRALDLGKDGLTHSDKGIFEEIGEEISSTERRAMSVEREVRERLVVSYIADQVGAAFDGLITGVTKFGLFIRLNEAGFSMTGERYGRLFRLGESVVVELAEAAPVTGSLSFRLIKGGTEPEPRSGKQPGKHRSPRQKSRRWR
jgi:ribonuclease R